MIQVAKQFKGYWEKWVKKRSRPGNPQILTAHNLYILPSTFGWVYGLVVLALLVGAINSQINTIFFMTFLLAMIGLVSAVETHANLKQLSLKFMSIEDAQQGTPAKITLFVQSNTEVRFGIELQTASQAKIRLEKIPPDGIQVIVPIQTETRGYFSLPPIDISSLFPLGIFKVWSYAYFEEHYYVYPQPLDPGFWPNPCLDQELKKKYVAGDEELYDLKQIESPWVQPNLIAWRIAAKGQGWYLKTMKSNEADYWLFKLKDLPSGDLESKLKNLSYWLQEAELNGLLYGLELKTTPTLFARGKEHLQHCLRQLAIYQ